MHGVITADAGGDGMRGLHLRLSSIQHTCITNERGSVRTLKDNVS